LLDIRFKRINYNESVRPKIYDRMISERRQIAERSYQKGTARPPEFAAIVCAI
jgi:modulator of FtsH protease HflC